jgi:hypothetical protein
VEHIRYRNLQVGQVRRAVVTVDFNYEEGANGKFKPVLRDVVIENVRSGASGRAVDLQGLPGAPAREIKIVGCDFRGVKEPSIVRHVEGLDLKGVRVNGQPAQDLTRLA